MVYLLILFNFLFITLSKNLSHLFKLDKVYYYIQNNYFNLNSYQSEIHYTLFIFNFVFVFLFVIFYILKKIKYKQAFRNYSNLQKLKNMNWEKYELLIKKIFEAKGYKVSRIGGHGSDGGIDLIIRKHGKKSMIQCKRYQNNVGVKTVREMYAVGIHHKFSKVYIYTSASFTKDAYEFAKGKNLILVNGEQTVHQMKALT